MPPQVTSTSYRQGVKIGLAVGLGYLVIWLSIGGAIWQATQRPFIESIGLGFVVIWGFVSLWLVAYWLFGRQGSGQLLLDCGPHRSKKLFLKLALADTVVFLVLGLLNGLDFISAPTEFRITGIAALLLCIFLVVDLLIMAMGRLQVRENGIWQYCSLLRWGKIESYHWTEDSTLLVRARGPISSRSPATLSVPPQYKDAFDQLLQKYCAARPVR
jgi:hypothetical protein